MGGFVLHVTRLGGRQEGAQVLGPRGRHMQRGSHGGKEREKDPEGRRLASGQPPELSRACQSDEDEDG